MLLSEMIKYEQIVCNTYSLSQIIRGYLEKIHEPLLKERGNLRKILFQNEEQKESQRVESITKLKHVNEEIDKKWFSFEHVMRELYYMGQFGPSISRNVHMKSFKDLA